MFHAASSWQANTYHILAKVTKITVFGWGGVVTFEIFFYPVRDEPVQVNDSFPIVLLSSHRTSILSIAALPVHDALGRVAGVERRRLDDVASRVSQTQVLHRTHL